jgi:hypothetical protein
MMGTYPVVLKELQVDKGIPGLISFSEGMCFAREGIEPIAEGTVNPLNMDGSGFGEELAKRRANLDGKQLSMLISMLDGLGQAHIGRHLQRRPCRPTSVDRLTIRSCENRFIATPAIATPVYWTAQRARDGEGDRSLDEILSDASGGTGSNEAAGAVLHEASPSFAGICAVLSAVFFRTKDQNSSISTVERCKSCVKISVKACACSLARRNHSPIVSYLWPVISSAALRLPRRITTNRA